MNAKNDFNRYNANRRTNNGQNRSQTGQNIWRSGQRGDRNAPNNRPDGRDANNSQTIGSQTDGKLEANFPGIPLKRYQNQSNRAFNSSDKTDTKVDASGDSAVDPTDQLVQHFYQLDVKTNEDKNESQAKNTANSEPTAEVDNKKEIVANTDGSDRGDTKGNTTSGNGLRRNTMPSDNRTFSRRYTASHRTGNQNQSNLNYSLNQNKYQNYNRNERFGYNTKYDNNDQNRRTFKGKPPMAHKEYMQRVLPMPSYQWNGCDGVNPELVSYGPILPNPYYSGPTNYLMPTNTQSVASDSSSRSGKPVEDKNPDKGFAQNDAFQVTPHFVPFEPTAANPYPPPYFGFINQLITEQGMAYYFISVVPPNILPLPLNVNVNGTPILPSNCTVIYGSYY